MTQFQNGNPGGPGRPKGSRNKKTIWRERLAGLMEDAERDLKISMGRGNVAAIRFVYEQVLGKPKGGLVEFKLPRLKTAADLRRAQVNVLKAVAQGEIATGDALTVSAIIDKLRLAMENEEFEKRLEALEKRDEEDERRRRGFESYEQGKPAAPVPMPAPAPAVPAEPEEPEGPEDEEDDEPYNPILEAFKPVALPGELEPSVPPEPLPAPVPNFRVPVPPDEGASPDEMAAFEAELRASEARRQMFIDEHARWRKRGEPGPYGWDGDDDDPNYPCGRVIVDYDPLDPKHDYHDWDK